MTKNQAMWATGILLVSLVPIWRSGGREGLNLREFLINHTIWGPPIEYIPAEDYEAEFKRSISRHG